MARRYAGNKLADPAGYERTLERTRTHLKPSDTVIELGCGTGTTALRLAPAVARYVATDLSSEMIAIAREKARGGGVANAEFVEGAPQTAPGADASYDAALAFNLLHLVEARAEALQHVRRLLKPGGLFISKTPCLGEMSPLFRPLVPVMQLFGQAPYVAFFSGEELEREIAGAGFEIVERGRHGSRGKDARPFLVARKI